MPKKNDSLIMDLLEAPWWISIVVAFAALIGLKFIIPRTCGGSLLLSGAGRAISSFAVWVFLFFVAIGGLSALRAWTRGELLKGQTSLRTIRSLSWRSLEDLVREAYRRDGYSTIGNSGPGPDGGVDIVAEKDGETILVQCKQWKAQKLGVRTIREMFGVLNAERANEVHVVTSGYFTDEARDFARYKPIRLIDGPALLQMVRKAQSTHESRPTSQRKVRCPRCGSNMVLRYVKSPGQPFWKCENSPACTGIRLQER
jgi:restriction system protein